jgi:hypothetical protein
MKKNPKIEVLFYSQEQTIRVNTTRNKLEKTFDGYTAAAVELAIKQLEDEYRATGVRHTGLSGTFGTLLPRTFQLRLS